MEGYATGDSWWLSSPARPFAQEVGAPPDRLRIAWSAEHPNQTLDVAPAWRDAVRATAELLAEQGHDLVEVTPPTLDLGALALIPASATAVRPDLPDLDTLDAPNRTLVQLSEAVGALDLARAFQTLQLETRRVVACFDDYDVLLTPTLAAGPPAIGEQIMGEEDWDGMLRLLELVAFTPTWNMTGQPAVAIPSGFDAEGLPVSVQLVGRPADEATLIRLACVLEEARPWQHHHPPICEAVDA